MIQRFRLALVVLVMSALPSPAFAWGTAVHRFVISRAIDQLPPELKAFFDHFRPDMIVRVTDPDTWRNVGWEDDPNHFLNLGVPEFGPYPFVALPHEYGAAIEKFGMATLKKDGTLPWREQEEFGNLRRAFEGFPRNAPYVASNTVLFAAVAAHYVQDATEPLHVTDNYDGQMTGQHGLHSRFETALFERFESRLTVVPKPRAPISNIRDQMFELILESNRQAEKILAADKQAIAGKDFYDDEYFEKFFTSMKPLLEERIGEAISATTAVIVGAWQQAGKPAVRADAPRVPQKVRQPGGR